MVSKSLQCVVRYIDSNHNHAAWMPFEKGLLSGNCKTEPALWQKQRFPGWNEDIMFNGFLPLQEGGTT